MKRIYSLLFIPFLASSQAFAQDTKRDQLAVFAGYEEFPQLNKRNGYDLGVKWKHYLNKRFYTLVNFHVGVNDGTEKVSYERDGIHYNFDLNNSVRNYMLGFGAGYDLLKIEKKYDLSANFDQNRYDRRTNRRHRTFSHGGLRHSQNLYH
ncbi:hypothetical protein, secreted [gut metagenome]|uniref:Outer membrane protein beta-barrel domain-containing protein n=1 Tax=gut metagenome TaxID=749906 RepID=J9G957_9ZZZZ